MTEKKIQKNQTQQILTDKISSHFRLGSSEQKALGKLGMETIRDLLYHFPVKYGDSTSSKLISDLITGEHATIYGRISSLKTGKAFRSKIPIAEGFVHDDSGRVKVLWLHQPYIAKLIQNDSFVKITGKVSEKNGVFSFMNPEVESVGSVPINTGESLFKNEEGGTDFHGGMPIYKESRGVTSRWFYHAVQKIIKTGYLENLDDPIPANILEKYNLPSIRTAFIWIHSPKKESDALAARKRFAFEEVFFIQLKNEITRYKHSKEKSFLIGEMVNEKKGSKSVEVTKPASVEKFISRFDFKLTEAQLKSIDAVLEDFAGGKPMSRLLEGDVGSGKTAVAAATAYAVVNTRPKNSKSGTLQVGYMAPTEILAKQHFESFIKYFSHMPISVGLITGNGCRKFPSKVNPSGWTDISRSQFLKWVANGEIAVVIGTHALIQKSVKFKNLAYVIIDEQHRFGTAQRQKLAKKDDLVPHLLSMTATPIPRTLALTIYGDLDLSLLDQMPAGRKQIITKIITPSERDATYEKVRTELSAGRQAYIICPRIDEPDPDKEQAVLAKSVKEEAKRLKKSVFQEYEIGILHSKMKPDEKDKIMAEFSDQKIDILVATSVVEVGVNVPNATVIIIEGAERFGLAQLHQLRGRVLRGTFQPHCFVFTESQTDKTLERLKALITAKNGFELSELDLKLRGTGELYGMKQWGISDVAMEAIKNIKMVEAARTEARKLISEDPNLSSEKNLGLAEILSTRKDIHFE